MKFCRRLSDQEKLEVVEKYQNGGAYPNDLAKEYGSTGSSIRRILKRRGIQIVRPPWNAEKCKRSSNGNKQANQHQTGQKFNCWTVLEILPPKNNKVRWKCQCDCGNIKELQANNVKRGLSKRCVTCKLELAKDIVFLDKKDPILVLSNLVYASYKRSATSRKLSFEISFEDFLILVSKPCFYCSTLKSNKCYRKIVSDQSFEYNGIDRVDNQEGYTKLNCVPCCVQCNFAKNAYTQENFIKWVEKVYLHLKQNGFYDTLGVQSDTFYGSAV